MTRYLLDTNILIAAIKGVTSIRARLASVDASEIVLSPIVLGELQLGVEKSRLQSANRAALARVMQSFACLPLDGEVARHYGEIRARLERLGQTIGANDYWIAAQARALDLTLVSDNVGEFQRVDGLRLENWLRDLQAPR
ncbi:PIN domain-containing protein [Wenzhouxiangella limi]|uniref:Ribonuclease VapC n=1 Tax=Wenzhouxiangella limi TaxID=2707351 RepID=A0A845UV42_9GAMM|nr:PIN domain-containing protein [Wenzhouxiangella limi]NDY94414.1 type II toxin-antitoxin system VapC family toxin [Wenzhouxiangella limi]